MGGFNGDSAPNFSDLADYAERFFDHPVQVLPPVELCVDVDKKEVLWLDTPATRELGQTNEVSSMRLRRRKSERTSRYPLEARFHRASGNYQLHAGSVLAKVKQIIPDDSICLMALTMSDIYDTPADLFVAGLAAGNHCVGVFSLKRYDPSLCFSTEYWHEIEARDLEMGIEQKAVTILQRSCKLLVHEIAHLLGVDHCIWYSCCMNGSGHLSEDFQQSMHLCPVDLKKLQHLCGFDVVQRYQRLGEYFRIHRLLPEKEWIKKRLQFIKIF